MRAAELIRAAYPAVLTPDDGAVSVGFPDVPEALTWGADRAEALARAEDALVTALSLYVDEGRPIPPPSPAEGRPLVAVPALEAAKLALHQALREAGVRPWAGASVDPPPTVTHHAGMIGSFRHKGLRQLYETGDRRGVRADQAAKLRRILAKLEAAATVRDCDAPGFRLHPLKGDRQGFWAIDVSGNWRVVFRFADGDALDVDLVDYH
jgi:proteic killer suppression protein